MTKRLFIKYCKLVEKLAQPESKLLEDICRQMPLRERERENWFPTIISPSMVSISHLLRTCN
jgi:hypothetical protein